MEHPSSSRVPFVCVFALVTSVATAAHADDATPPAAASASTAPTAPAPDPLAPGVPATTTVPEPTPAPTTTTAAAPQPATTAPAIPAAPPAAPAPTDAVPPTPSGPPSADPKAVPNDPLPPPDPYDKFRVGPVLSLGIPRMLGAGLLARLGKYVSLGVNYQVLPKMKLPIYSATATSFLVEGYGRLHPFGGAFYLSFGGGYQETFGTASAGAVGAEAELKSAVLTASIGWFWQWNDGFGIGIEPLGLSIPVGSRDATATLVGDPDVVSAANEYTDIRQQVEDTVDQIGKYPVPQFNLVRIGLLF
ncbi:MAG: hypothetical protein U0169_01920 [Polyangiaceae bacterium]